MMVILYEYASRLRNTRTVLLYTGKYNWKAFAIHYDFKSMSEFDTILMPSQSVSIMLFSHSHLILLLPVVLLL